MNPEYRQRLLSLSSQLDQWVAEADGILKEPGDVELGCYAEELRELLVTMQAKIESKLELGAPVDSQNVSEAIVGPSLYNWETHSMRKNKSPAASGITLQDLAHIGVAVAAVAFGAISLIWQVGWLGYVVAIIANAYLILLLIEVAMRRKSEGEAQRWLLDVPLSITTLAIVAMLAVAIVTSFASMYLSSDGVAENARDGQQKRLDNVYDAVYFSTVTFTTLGYGDFVPVTRWLCMLVVWQLATTVLFLLGILPLLVSRLADFDLRNQPPG